MGITVHIYLFLFKGHDPQVHWYLLLKPCGGYSTGYVTPGMQLSLVVNLILSTSQHIAVISFIMHDVILLLIPPSLSWIC